MSVGEEVCPSRVCFMFDSRVPCHYKSSRETAECSMLIFDVFFSMETTIAPMDLNSTAPKTDMSPEKEWLEEYFPFEGTC